MKIILTGSTGFLGMYVLQELRQHGHEVIPVDISAKNRDEVESDADTKILDISKPGELDHVTEGADAICHLGNKPFIREDRANEGFANNVAATFNVFQAALRANIRKIVWASSIQAYGVVSDGGGSGISAPLYLPIDESHPLLPRTAYQLSKQVGENAADAFLRRRPEMQVFSLRLTYISGPTRPAERMQRHLKGSLMTHIDVADAARAVRLCLEIDRPGHTPLNIVASHAPSPWTMEAIRETFGHVPEIRGSLNEQEPLFSAKKAKEVLGFEA